MQNNNGIGGNGNTITQLPMFKGVNYHFWSLRMKTLFRSQELWSIVEDGFTDGEPAEPSQELRDKRKKDAKASTSFNNLWMMKYFPELQQPLHQRRLGVFSSKNT